MSDTIIDKLNSSPEEIVEEDIKAWVLSEVLDFFDPKFGSLSRFAYGNLETGADLAKRAFKQRATETLEKGLLAFLFKSQHWKSGRNIQPYLTTCINRLADNIKRECSTQKKKSIPICPACKSQNSKEFLRYEEGSLRCHSCTNEQNILEDRAKSEISKEDPDSGMIVKLRSEVRLRKIFALHSRKGYRCPDCAMFIPTSFVQGQRASCPYDLSCMWFGHIDELEFMSHPVGLSSENHLSLNSTIKFDSGKEIERQESIASGDVGADVQIEIRQKCELEVKTIYAVMENQSAVVKRESKHKGIKKVLMYEAFKNVLNEYPADMVSYLAHCNNGGGLAIQARVFQNFVELVENSLPIEVYHKGKVVEIYSIQDPRLDLFAGFSEFESTVRPDGIIPNCTKEVYIGSRKGINHGRCFIGQLVEIQAIDADNQSLMDFVDFYTFSQIKMKDDVPPGIRVRVKHFRILSHYEMQGLVYLQRIRRKIVDSVHLRLNGERRKVGKANVRLS